MHHIANARYITVHRGSIIVLCHFVRGAFVVEVPFKHNNHFRLTERNTLTPLEQNVLVNSTLEVEK